MTARQRLPNRRGSLRFVIRHDGAAYLVTLSRFDDGRLAEVFIDAVKPDSALAVHAHDAAVLASLLLQHGVTAAAIRHSVSGPIATALAEADTITASSPEGDKCEAGASSRHKEQRTLNNE